MRKYGVNYACPPDCGTTAEMEQKVKAYPQGLFLQTMWQIDDPMDNAAIKKAKGSHNQMVRQLIDSLEGGDPRIYDWRQRLQSLPGLCHRGWRAVPVP